MVVDLRLDMGWVRVVTIKKVTWFGSNSVLSSLYTA